MTSRRIGVAKVGEEFWKKHAIKASYDLKLVIYRAEFDYLSGKFELHFTSEYADELRFLQEPKPYSIDYSPLTKGYTLTKVVP